MADNKSKSNANQTEETQGVVGPTHVGDGAAYVLQSTSYKLRGDANVVGDVPEERFMEEVLRDSDEAKNPIRDAHPKENQPVPGIGPDDELPDTTGRAALAREKK